MPVGLRLRSKFLVPHPEDCRCTIVHEVVYVVVTPMLHRYGSKLIVGIQEEFMVEKRPERKGPMPEKVLQRNRRMFGALLGHLDGAEYESETSHYCAEGADMTQVKCISL